MATVFNILAVLVMVAVVVVLIRGLVNMLRGGSGSTSNKLMQARVLLQFIALVLILLALYVAGRCLSAGMVKLNKIYTRTGDDGTTGLGSGERRLKSDLRVEAYGTVDEANAAIGLARLHTAAAIPNSMPCSAASRTTSSISAPTLRVPDNGKKLDYEPLRIIAAQTARIEADIDRLNKDLQPLQILRAARRLAGRGRASSRPHGCAAGRAHDGGAGRRTRPSMSTARASDTSTASRISCSSPAGWSMTTEMPTCYGCPARTAETVIAGGSGGTRCSFRFTTPTA